MRRDPPGTTTLAARPRVLGVVECDVCRRAVTVRDHIDGPAGWCQRCWRWPPIVAALVMR